MISFILLSSLLSLAGLGLYLVLIRRLASAWQRKTFIYLVIGLSLGLPLGKRAELLPQQTEFQSSHYAAMFGQVPQAAIQQHCQCQQPNYAHRIHYRADAALAGLVVYQPILRFLLLTSMGLVLLLFIGQMLYLYWLVYISEQSPTSIHHTKVHLILPPSRFSKSAVGAFWLGKSYILWDNKLNSLPYQARQAILRHELSHLHQFNTIERLFLRLIHCLWFINPAFYLFKKELDLLSEFIADDAALAGSLDKTAYARLLLAIKTESSNSLISSFGGSILKVRVKRLFSSQPNLPRGVYVACLLLSLGSQWWLTPLLAQQSDQVVSAWQAYYLAKKQVNSPEEGYICTDCGTLCQPEELQYPNPCLQELP